MFRISRVETTEYACRIDRVAAEKLLQSTLSGRRARINIDNYNDSQLAALLSSFGGIGGDFDKAFDTLVRDLGVRIVHHPNYEATVVADIAPQRCDCEHSRACQYLDAPIDTHECDCEHSRDCIE